MGAYLSKPVTEKISSDENNEHLTCGASSMQGWRIYQEDAHNVILNYEEAQSFFAVYDGHGGHEVAVYASKELPDFLKKAYNYSKEQFSQALIDAFLEFDSTIIEPEVLAILKEILGMKDQDDSDYDGKEVDHLCREASMPLEEVMAKYGDSHNIQSPCLRPKKSIADSLEAGSSQCKDELDSSNDDLKTGTNVEGSSKNIENNSDNKTIEPDTEVKEYSNDTSDTKSSESFTENSSSTKAEESSSITCNGISSKDSIEKASESSSELVNGNSVLLNGKIKDEGGGLHQEKDETKAEHTGKLEDKKIVSSEIESKDLNGDVSHSPKGKGKGGSKGKGIFRTALMQAMKVARVGEKKRKAAKKAEQIYKQIQIGKEDLQSDDEDEDDDDENFEEVCPHQCEDVSSSDEEEEESEEDMEDEGEDEEEDSEECANQYHEFSMNMREEPGYDSGCTACVAFMNGRQLYVANVGDSRCVVCRDGKAIDMSVDHKPEDQIETDRITKAGGRISLDGRVNGGLNLSRALGDHSYKQNKALRPEEQMISPLPDIKSLSLTTEDQYMVIACDGIWNSMSSQEVCDFVSERIQTQSKLSVIAEELFDHCLCPDSFGDGTGCDNMTCIIVKFHFPSKVFEVGKRPSDASEDSSVETPQEKKCRLETKE